MDKPADPSIAPPTAAALTVPWVASPFFDALLAERDLDPAMAALARTYHDDGVVVLADLADDELIERIRAETASLYRDEVSDGPRSRYRVQDAWRESGAVRELAGHPRVLETLRMLYGREPFPFQTLNFRHGSEQHGHADSIHFSSVPAGFMCGVWVALEDVGPDNGPLFYYPGSHQLPSYGPYDIGLSVEHPDYARYEAFLEDLVNHQRYERTVLTIQRGSALIWAADLVHGGTPIERPGATRLSQVTHYYFEGCIYYTPVYSNPVAGEYVLKDVVDVRNGRRVPHSFNGVPVRATHYSGPRSLIAFGSDSRGVRKAAVPTSPAGWYRHLVKVGKRIVARRGGRWVERFRRT